MRRMLFAAALLAGLASSLASAQAPPPIPALPDTERRTAYTNPGLGPVAVNFALYGDGSDYQNWVEVFINGVRANFNDALNGWTITSPSGPLGSIARPITDAQLTFTHSQSGTVQIVGARRPRRTSQFQENQGVAARDLNQVFTDLTAQNRETWDKINDVTGRALLSQPGVILGLLPPPASCVNAFLTFDASGINPICTAGGTLVVVTSVTPLDGSLNITPTTGAVQAQVNMANANIWIGLQTFSGGFSLGAKTATSIAGNSGQLATQFGSIVPGHCIAADANGNLVDQGGACVSSSSGVNAGTAGQAGYYAANGSVISGTSVGNLGFTQSGGTISRTIANRFTDFGTNILDFGADPTGANDSTAAIQAAIDATFNTQNRVIYCPDGKYKISLPIYLDAPGNLRTGDPQPWSSTFPGGYQFGIAVTYLGVTYISLQNGNNNNQPNISPTWWQPLVWNSGTTYAQGAYVTFGGYPWISQSNGNLNNTPGAGSAFWTPTALTPGVFNFGFTFTGNLGAPAPVGGCWLQATFNNAVAFYVGSGNGSTVANLQIVAPASSLYRGQLPVNGIGLCIVGGNGGAVRTLIENVNANGFRTGYEVSCNAVNFQTASLGEENKFINVGAANCFAFVIINGSQNFVNNFIDPAAGCTFGFFNNLSPSIGITGGSLSTEFGNGPSGNGGTSFSISGTSAVTSSGSIPALSYSFTTTVASPDTNITNCGQGGTSPGNCVYNAWTLVTQHFGPIPLTMTNWNAGTNVATFKIYQPWADYFTSNNSNDATTQTNISAEIQAATSIRADELATVFSGKSYRVSHVHVEQGVCTTFFSNNGAAGDAGSSFDNIYFNYNIARPGDSSLCQAAWPFITGSATNYEFRQSQFGGGGGSPNSVNIDIPSAVGVTDFRCLFDLQGVPVVKSGLGYVSTRVIWSNAANLLYTPWGGGCDWSDSPYVPFIQSSQPQYFMGAVPFTGFHAALHVMPRMVNELIPILLAVAPGTALNSYPPLDGGTIYSVLDPSSIFGGSTLGPAKLLQSGTIGASYGQNLTTSNVSGLSWAKLGQSCFVLADANTLQTVFPGLGITLAEASNTRYIVTGIFSTTSLDGGTHPGYFTVYGAGSNNNRCGTGVKTTVYTGTTILQDSFVFNQIGSQVPLGTPNLTSCGTSPALTSGSLATTGSFTTGTATPTACTLNFAAAFPSVANCTISPANTAANGVSGGTYISAQSTSGFTITLGTGTNSAKYNYTCGGN